MSEHKTRIASTPTARTSRREALRLLSGLALASAGASIGAAESVARKKRKKDGKGNGARRPTRVRVPHDGSVVYSEKLEAGKRYRLRVSGYLSGSGVLLPEVGVDAGYIFRPGGDPSLAKDVYAGIDFGLSIDGAAADWGPLQTSHVYSREVIGAGKRLALRMITEAADSLSQSNQGEPSARRLIEVNPVLTLSGALTVEVRRM